MVVELESTLYSLEEKKKMILDTINYAGYEVGLPQDGRHLLAQTNGQEVIVYQAFNNCIADYAITNQSFGGNCYSFNRMSWIKPNFLWMMFRNGWGVKENQERTLAISISKEHFASILELGVFSSFKPNLYASDLEWKTALSNSDVRLQWDPDHYPNGDKHDRRAIQIGMRRDILYQFCTDWIISIKDISDFVEKQRMAIQTKSLDALRVPRESVFLIESLALREKLLSN